MALLYVQTAQTVAVMTHFSADTFPHSKCNLSFPLVHKRQRRYIFCKDRVKATPF